MKKVCIVGASGKLGQYMVQHALDRGYEVVLTVLVPWGVHQYSTGTAQAVLDHAAVGARRLLPTPRPGNTSRTPSIPGSSVS